MDNEADHAHLLLTQELHEERLDHYRDRIEALEAAREKRDDQKKERRLLFLEIIVVVFVVIEAAVEILMYLFPNHGQF